MMQDVTPRIRNEEADRLAAPVLVTGVTGFIGRRLALALVARGCRVRGLTRRDSGLDDLVQDGIEVVRGDLADPAALERVCDRQRLVFHAAGRVSDWGPRQGFVRVNVEGTAHLIAACVRTNVERLVHLSSLTVLGLPNDARSIDEATPYGTPLSGDHYTATKIAGEQLVRAASAEGRLATTVVRPGAVWGPGDRLIVPRIVRLLRRGLMPVIGDGKNVLGLSHIDNLVDGLILAGRMPRAAGHVYHLTDGEEVTAAEALAQVAEAYGLQPPRTHVPYWAIYGLAAALEAAARVTGRAQAPAITRYGVRFVACDCRYDIDKARSQLGYQPRVSFRAGMRELARAGTDVDAS
jgi:nucleoside-diphosphate-sugar epimerase